MKKVFKILGLLILLIIVSLFVYNLILGQVYKNPPVDSELSANEAADLLYLNELKANHGETIWPGFGKANIPVIFFNDKYEFLYGYAPKEKGWRQLNQKKNAIIIYRRDASNPQAFAVTVDDRWVASIGTVDHMNRDMFFGIKKEVPKAFGYIFPFFVFKMTREMQISGTIHEMFHVWEAVSNESKFLAAEATHSALNDYPYGDIQFSNYWNREGQWLAKALKAEEESEFYACVDSFLHIRTTRRSECRTDARHTEAEKGLEWLEGMAKYAEYRSYMLAAGDTPEGHNFKSDNAYWQREQADRLRRMGSHGGDNRFYHSGAAQAFILDRLNPDWKNEIMSDGIYLEDLVKKYHIAATATM